MAEDHEHQREEEVKKDDERNDWLFCDRDTDSEDDDDDEAADESDTDSDDIDDPADNGRRRCLDVNLCQHAHKRFKGGLPFFELFKVKLKFNDKLPTNKPFEDARLCGEIETLVQEHIWDRHNPFPISFYRVSPSKPDLLLNLDRKNNSVLVPISGPEPRPILCDCNYIGLRFALKVDDEDIFDDGAATFYWDPNRDDLGSCDYCDPYAVAVSIGDPHSDRILLSAHYAIYRGSCATVEVKMLKELGVCGFYGSIVARSCVFYSRTRLLTVRRDRDKKKERDGKSGKVGPGGSIELTRSIVAVPMYSSLVVGAQLYDDDGDEGLICCGRVAFAAKETGEETNYVSCKGVRVLEVRVQWRCDYEFHEC